MKTHTHLLFLFACYRFPPLPVAHNLVPVLETLAVPTAIW